MSQPDDVQWSAAEGPFEVKAIVIYDEANPPPASKPSSFGLYRIHDVEGYDWELDWTDPDGEAWSVECHTLEEALEEIKDIFESWSTDDKP